MKLNEKIVAIKIGGISVKIHHKWMYYTLKIYWLQYLPSPMVECDLNPWLEFLAT